MDSRHSGNAGTGNPFGMSRAFSLPFIYLLLKKLSIILSGQTLMTGTKKPDPF